MNNSDVRIIVLNYQGEKLLQECMPSIVAAAADSSYSCAVSVLDNRSTDGSKEWLRENCPSVSFVSSESNRILCSYNPYIASLSEKYVILLNNDIRVDKGFIDPMINRLISDPTLFFVSPKTLSPADDSYEGGKAKLQMRRGLLWGTSRFEGYEKTVDEPGISMQTGFGAFDREKFLKLGGYDDLYLPGTVEDSDLCFRAWKMGWKGFYEPGSVVWHMGQSSFKKAFGSEGINRMNYRNLYLFVWKNVRDSRLIALHILWIIPQIMLQVIRLRWMNVAGFFQALKMLPEAMKRRKKMSEFKTSVSDTEIFRISESIS